jgi:chorismate mutase
MKLQEQIGAEKKAKCCGLQNKRWNEILGKMILDGEEKDLSRRIYT